MVVSNPKTLNLNDIQGMVTRGYAKLFQTQYWLLTVKNAKKAKEWIGDSIPLIDTAEITHRPEKTLHLSFTHDGLKALGLAEENLKSFPYPFKAGMVTEGKSRVLADYGDSAPEKWRWGKKGKANNIHVLAIYHATDEAAMKKLLDEETTRLEANGGFEISTQMNGFNKKDYKEPFGFHDGISQPVIKGSGRSAPENDLIEPGEFLMGYKDEHNQFPVSPLLKKLQGNYNSLPDEPTPKDKNKPLKDLGHNGTFMVFRQMEQHVKEFWAYMERQTKDSNGSINKEASIKLASKCMGRWPSGASLVNFPDKDPNPEGTLLSNDDFGYAEKDKEGLRCPFGSHLRRNNPRDHVRTYSPKKSLKVSNRHRIIRRGRIYENKSPTTGVKEEEGLHFICFNTNIEFQFEFIQHAWGNNNQLTHLKNDIDVIIGAPIQGDPNGKDWVFTEQAKPVNKFYSGFERFTTIKGGEYFFMPSITFLNFIKTI